MAQVSPKTGKALAWIPVALLGVFIVAPQLAMILYAFFANGQFTFSGFQGLFDDSAFYSSLGLSVIIAVTTVVVLIITLVPAVVAVHLWAPKLSGTLSILCTLPLVIPAIALVAGLLQILRTMSATGRGTPLNALSMTLQNNDFPIALIGTYVVLCLPFTYRSINAALSSIPLKVFFEASSSLGAGTWKTLFSIVLPNIRGSILFSAFFAFALGFAEYTVASVMSVRTLPVYMTTLSATNFRASIALSILSNFITWGLLALAMVTAERAGKKSARNARRSKASEKAETLDTAAAVATPATSPAQSAS